MAVTHRSRFFALVALLACAAVASAAGGDARLVDAARNRDVQAARSLVRVVDVNAAPVDGATALHWAAHWDDLELATILLRAGANSNRANDYGVTPLWLACTNGSARMTKALLDARATPGARTTNGESVLMEASRTGNLDVVQLLLKAGADPNVADNYRGQTALMWAIAEGHVDVVRALLDAGADVHARTKPERNVGTPKSRGGSTPLIFAVRDGNLPLVELLVSRGARIDDKPADDGSTPLLVATVRGHVDLAIWLLARGADPNVAAAGYTPLHWAVGVWDSLLTHDSHFERGEWANARGIETESQRMRLIRALLMHGADPNARNTGAIPHFGGSVTGQGEGQRAIESGATPYLLAAMSGEPEVMRMLVAAGADPKVRSGTPSYLPTLGGATALIAAAGEGHIIGVSTVSEGRYLEAVKVALELGADINETDARGLTALHSAAYVGFDKIIQFLAAGGANLNAADERGRTPLDVAEADVYLGSMFSNPTSAAVLRKLGAERGTCVTPKDDVLGYAYCATERMGKGQFKVPKGAKPEDVKPEPSKSEAGQ